MKCCSDPDSVATVGDPDVVGTLGGVTMWEYRRCPGSPWERSTDYPPSFLGMFGWYEMRVAERGGDCDGLTHPWIWSPAGSVEWPPHATETTIPLGINGYRRVVNGVEHYHSSDGLKWVKTTFDDGVRIERANEMRPLPPEKVEAARKAIEIMKRRREGIASGYWPFGWEPDDKHRTYPDGHGGVIRLPNTERGRRAAWELEGA